MSEDDNQDSKQDSKRVLQKNIAFQYLLQIAIYVFPFITLPYLTRVLGPDEFAVRAYAASMISIVATLVSYGFNTFGTREVARNREDKSYLSKLCSNIFVLRIYLAVIGGVVVFTLSFFIPIMRENQAYMLITYVGYCLSGMLPDFIFQGLEDMSILTKRFVVSRLVSLILIFAFVRSADQLILVAVFETVPSFIAFAWSWFDVVVKRGIKLDLKKYDKSYAWSLFKTSTTFFLSSVSTVIFTSLTTVMIGIYILNQAEISYWSLAITVVSAVQSLFSPIVNSVYPHVVVNRNFGVVKKFLLAGIPLVFLGCVLIFIFADLIMFILGGEEYLEGSYIIQLVTPLIFFSYPAMLLGFPVLAAIDKEKQLTTTSVVSAIFHIIGLVVLASFGIFTVAAVAILRCATEFVLFATRTLYVFQARKELTKVQEDS